MKRLLYIVLLLTLISTFAVAQRATLDYKVHNVGSVRQLVTNMGTWWRAYTNYPGLIYSEYPPRSNEEHVGEGGIWIGALVGSDTLVSCTTSWNSSFEFYPTSEPWDTVWVVNKGERADIPYWMGYTAVSDQDFVCRYQDYALTNIAGHTPLFVDVRQTSYAWSSPPLDGMIIFNYTIIPTRYHLEKAYIAFWLDGNVGYRGGSWAFALDDYSLYYEDLHLGVAADDHGRDDGDAYSPIGVKIFPPDDHPADSLRWTFNWYSGQGMGAPPSRDGERYLEMAAGIVMQNQLESVGSQFIISFGPFDLQVGDTLRFSVAELLGEGLEGVLHSETIVSWLKERNYQVPAPPPMPPLKVTADAQSVLLNWKAESGEVDPETYEDEARADQELVPFEGYRVYKSTESENGPWTLLAEFDLPGNRWFNNTGLGYSYSDVGLLNNLEYYYTVTAFSKPDTTINFPSQESSKTKNARTVTPGTRPPANVGSVSVVPNPYRGDIAYDSYNPSWEKPGGTRDRWMEQDRKIQFINLPARSEIKIYTLSGDLVQVINHDHPDIGYENWNLTSAVGQAIASGIYLFSVRNLHNGDVQVGKFIVIK
ncbi:MAG TPA: hypothetical protein PKN04_16260 [bacterium]|nr:hypothetical protein [bacterium]HOX87338.1 hypothetical protein [bacterium]HPG46799.1 hypothetical protein [bacterium]HPM98871.1 hypothetical protein [bacterium]